MENAQKKNTNYIYVLLAVIALLLGTNIYTFLKKNKTETTLTTVTDERAGLQKELNQLEAELAEATNSTTELSAELEEKNLQLKSKVEELQNSLKKGNMSAGQLSKSKKEIDQLRIFVSNYQTEVEELKVENERLNTENTGLKQTVVAEQTRASNLASENTNLSGKISAASILKSENLTITPVRERSSGKESDVTKAKNVDKIKISFTLANNDIAEKGSKDFYLRILDPKGNLETVTDREQSMFKGNNQDMQYTAKYTINFDNMPQVYNMYWTKSTNFEKGMYEAVLFADGTIVGNSKFELK